MRLFNLCYWFITEGDSQRQSLIAPGRHEVTTWGLWIIRHPSPKYRLRRCLGEGKWLWVNFTPGSWNTTTWGYYSYSPSGNLSISEKLTKMMHMCTFMLQKLKTCNDINYLGWTVSLYMVGVEGLFIVPLGTTSSSMLLSLSYWSFLLYIFWYLDYFLYF